MGTLGSSCNRDHLKNKRNEKFFKIGGKKHKTENHSLGKIVNSGNTYLPVQQVTQLSCHHLSHHSWIPLSSSSLHSLPEWILSFRNIYSPAYVSGVTWLLMITTFKSWFQPPLSSSWLMLLLNQDLLTPWGAAQLCRAAWDSTARAVAAERREQPIILPPSRDEAQESERELGEEGVKQMYFLLQWLRKSQRLLAPFFSLCLLQSAGLFYPPPPTELRGDLHPF